MPSAWISAAPSSRWPCVNERGEIKARARFRRRTPPAWTPGSTQSAAGWSSCGRKRRREAASAPASASGVPGFVDFERGFIYDLANVPGWTNVPLAELPGEALRPARARGQRRQRDGPGRVHLRRRAGLPACRVHHAGHRRGRRAAHQQPAVPRRLLHGRRDRPRVDRHGRHRVAAGPRRRWSSTWATGASSSAPLQAIEQGSAVADPRPGAGRLRARSRRRSSPRRRSQGDALALEMFDFVADCLATAFASVAYLIQPQAFIIGGGVAQSGDGAVRSPAPASERAAEPRVRGADGDQARGTGQRRRRDRRGHAGDDGMT